ncbi:hypothetical protein Tco_0192164, partial [Tanacetum coccineum]
GGDEVLAVKGVGGSMAWCSGDDGGGTPGGDDDSGVVVLTGVIQTRRQVVGILARGWPDILEGMFL